MKKAFTIVLSFLCTAGFAQTLEKSDLCPAVYESYKTLRIRNPKSFQLFSAGLQQSWDFSQMSYVTDTFSRYDFMPAFATPYKLEFPGSELAMLGTVSYDNSFKAYWYYSDSAASLFELGSERGFINFHNSDPERVLQFPMQFGSAQHDLFCFQSEAFGSSNNYCGRNKVTYDADGTLVLPYGSFQNVKRVRYESWTVNLNTPNDSSGVIRYSWYKKGVHKAMLEYTLFIDTQGDTIYTANMLSPSSANTVNEPELSMSIYPNPASDMLFVQSAAYINKLEILDLSGRAVYQLEPGSDKVQIQTGSITAGIYFIVLETEKGRICKKLMLIN